MNKIKNKFWNIGMACVDVTGLGLNIDLVVAGKFKCKVVRVVPDKIPAGIDVVIHTDRDQGITFYRQFNKGLIVRDTSTLKTFQ